MTTLRLGLAGLGHGDTLIQANNPENELPIRVTALCDINEARLDAASRKHGIGTVTTDFDELAERDDIDIIGIYTPGPLHARQILKALENGKHVMVTKSMVYTMKEAESVVEAVDRTGLVLLVTQSMRGRLDFIDAKRACDAGEIGELFMGGGALCPRPPPCLQADTMADNDAARSYLGRCMSSNRPAALVHGRHRRSPLCRLA